MSATIKPPSNRVRIIDLRPEEILELFNHDWLQADFLRVPGALNLPEGTIARDVCFSWEIRSFRILVEHESFAEVENGAVPPSCPVRTHQSRTVIRIKEMEVAK